MAPPSHHLVELAQPPIVAPSMDVILARTPNVLTIELAWLLLAHEGGDPAVARRSVDATIPIADELLLHTIPAPLLAFDGRAHTQRVPAGGAAGTLVIAAIDHPVDRLAYAFDVLVVRDPDRRRHPAWRAGIHGDSIDLGAAFRAFVTWVDAFGAVLPPFLAPQACSLRSLPSGIPATIATRASRQDLLLDLSRRSGKDVSIRAVLPSILGDAGSLLDESSAAVVVARYGEDLDLLGLDGLGCDPRSESLLLPDVAMRLLASYDDRLARLAQLNASWRHRLWLDRGGLTRWAARRVFGDRASA